MPSRRPQPGEKLQPFQALARLPWTLLSLATMLLVAGATGLFGRATSPSTIRRWGLGLDTLEQGRVHTLITASYLVDHQTALLSGITLVAVFVGSYELAAGPGWAALGWFLGTWSTTVVGALVWLPFAWLGWARPVRDVVVAEVGSSGAGWCCLGAVLGVPWRWAGWRRWAGVSAVSFLSLGFITDRIFVNVEHPVAFAFGALALGMLMPPETPRATLDRATAARLLSVLAGLLVIIVACLAGVTTFDGLLVLAGLVEIVVALLAPPRWNLLLLALVAAGSLPALAIEPDPATAATLLAALALLALEWRGSGRPREGGGDRPAPPTVFARTAGCGPCR